MVWSVSAALGSEGLTRACGVHVEYPSGTEGHGEEMG